MLPSVETSRQLTPQLSVNPSLNSLYSETSRRRHAAENVPSRRPHRAPLVRLCCRRVARRAHCARIHPGGDFEVLVTQRLASPPELPAARQPQAIGGEGEQSNKKREAFRRNSEVNRFRRQDAHTQDATGKLSFPL